MKYFKLPIYALAAALMTAPTVANAWWWHWDDDDDDEEAIPLDEAELFFELNDTDGDLGIHGFADGDEWKVLEIEAPNGRELMKINVRSKLKRQGVTELFFESAEPCFPDDCEDGDVGLDPEKFFKRFPEGIYEIEVELLDGGERESEVYLSHLIPAAPEVASIEGAGGSADEPEEEGECWGLISGAVDVVVDWYPVTMSHEDLGTPRDAALGDNEVINYEFVAEIDGTDHKSTAIVPPETTAWTIPAEFIALAVGAMVENDAEELEPVDEIKFEILVRVDNGEGNPGNKSALEGCYLTDIND